MNTDFKVIEPDKEHVDRLLYLAEENLKILKLLAESLSAPKLWVYEDNES